MHFHLPKPLHGWREFAGEVGIIVVGVLIALGAEQVVETMHWRHMTAEARDSMNDQLSDSQFASLERIKRSACMERQLDRMDELLNGPKLPPIRSLNISGLRTWKTSAWDAAVASGAVSHLDMNARNDYAALFNFTKLLGELNMKEFELGSDLRTVEHHPNLDSVSRDRLERDVSQMKAVNRVLTLGAEQWLDRAKTLNVRLAEDDRKELANPVKCPMPGDAPKA